MAQPASPPSSYAFFLFHLITPPVQISLRFFIRRFASGADGLSIRPGDRQNQSAVFSPVFSLLLPVSFSQNELCIFSSSFFALFAYLHFLHRKKTLIFRTFLSGFTVFSSSRSFNSCAAFGFFLRPSRLSGIIKSANTAESPAADRRHVFRHAKCARQIFMASHPPAGRTQV